MLEPVENVPKENFDLIDMSPEERVFYAASMAESEKEWKGKQTEVVTLLVIYFTNPLCHI